jgi:hypothetical protein
MADVVNNELLSDINAGNKGGVVVSRIRPVDNTNKPPIGMLRFINDSNVDIKIVTHTIPANGHKDFYEPIGRAMLKVPIIVNLIRLKKISVYDGGTE